MSNYNDSIGTTSLAGDLLKIHGGYQPTRKAYVTYYDINDLSSLQKVRFYENTDLSIMMPSSDFQDFKCWLISGQEFKAGEFFYDSTSSDISAMMSCSGSYTLKYDANGGYGKIKPVTLQYNKYVIEAPGGHAQMREYGTPVLAESTFSKTQYRFKEWNVNDTSYKPGDMIVLSNDTKAVAVWEYAPKYNLTVKSNNTTYGSVSKNSGVYEKGTQIQVTATPNSGYRLKRWNDGNTSLKRTIIIDRDITLIAEFEMYGYVVTFDGNGGICAEQQRIVTIGATIGELPVAEKDGFHFIGWFTAAKNGTQIHSNKIVNAAITLYAQYIRKVIRLKRVGRVQITGDDIASSFSNQNYLISYSEDDYINFADGLEFVIRAKTGSTLENQEVFGMGVRNSNLEFGCYNNKFMWEIATGSVTTGSLTAAMNKWYWFKVKKDANMLYQCYISQANDKTDEYVLDLSRTRNQKTYGEMLFGNDIDALAEYWRGEIDIKSSYMLINGFKITFEIIDTEKPNYIIDSESNFLIDNYGNYITYWQ